MHIRSAFAAVALACTLAAADEPRDLTAEVDALRVKINVPALSVVLFDDEHTLARGLAGVRSTENDTPITYDDRFHIGSLAKAMTATVAASLVEDGAIQWHTTLVENCTKSREIPELYRKVSLVELLAHRAGLPDDRHGRYALYAALWVRGDTPFNTRHDAVATSFALEGLAKRGAAFTYSNSGYMLAGHMLEEATDEPFEDLIRERLFEPLKMTRAGFGEPVEQYNDTEPRGHIRSGDTLSPAARGPFGALPPAMTPAGDIHCTVGDLAAFARAHLAGLRGTDGVVTADTFRLLHADPEKDGYALGWALDTSDPDAIVSNHAGSNMRWFAVMAIDPTRNRGLVAVMNAVPDDKGGVDLFGEIGRWFDGRQADPEESEAVTP